MSKNDKEAIAEVLAGATDWKMLLLNPDIDLEKDKNKGKEKEGET